MGILRPSSFHVHSEIADRLAWLHDSEDNELDNYPGAGWSYPDLTAATAEDEAEWAAFSLDDDREGGEA